MTTVETKPLVIPIFLPNAGCPHQCVFCNQRDITGRKASVCSNTSFNRIVDRFLQLSTRNRHPVQISFYGGNFLGLEKAEVQRLLDEAEGRVSPGHIQGIRFSTRPDTITEKRLSWLKPYSVTTIELGVQSLNDRVLAKAGRGHTADDVVRAVSLLKTNGYEIGLQMMVGLPGDNDKSAMATAVKIADMAPDFVRIYPTLVFRNSVLADWYMAGDYEPMPLDRCVSLVKKAYAEFRKRGIPVVRMGLQGSEEPEFADALLAGPFHPAFGHLVLSEDLLDRVSAELAAIKGLPEAITLRVHPSWESRLRGQGNDNMRILKERFGIRQIRVLRDPACRKGNPVVQIAG